MFLSQLPHGRPASSVFDRVDGLFRSRPIDKATGSETQESIRGMSVLSGPQVSCMLYDCHSYILELMAKFHNIAV